MKCNIPNCYKTGVVYGYCLVHWNKLPIPERNKVIRANVEYGKWQLGELDENIITQIEMQSFESVMWHPDMAPPTVRDFDMLQTFGTYFPPKDRVLYAGTIDGRSDGPMDQASVCVPAGSDFKFNTDFGEDEEGMYGPLDEYLADGIERGRASKNLLQQNIYVRKVKAPPKGYLSLGYGEWYMMLYGRYFKDMGQLGRDYGWTLPNKPGLFYEKGYIRIDWERENIHLGIRADMNYKLDARFLRHLKRRVTILTSLAVSAEADSKNLWHVRAFKDHGGQYLTGNIRIGVYGEHVKSLFFARDEPLTDTGRKKPILHWVSAHKRRLKNGIDIDIDKYLRGTRTLKIGETTFLITRPCDRELDEGLPDHLRKTMVKL